MTTNITETNIAQPDYVGERAKGSHDQKRNGKQNSQIWL